MIAIINETKPKQPHRIEHTTNPKANPQPPDIHKMPGTKINNGIDQEGQLDGQIGVGWG